MQGRAGATAKTSRGNHNHDQRRVALEQSLGCKGGISCDFINERGDTDFHKPGTHKRQPDHILRVGSKLEELAELAIPIRVVEQTSRATLDTYVLDAQSGHDCFSFAPFFASKILLRLRRRDFVGRSSLRQERQGDKVLPPQFFRAPRPRRRGLVHMPRSIALSSLRK
jgi:hypothetical protein